MRRYLAEPPGLDFPPAVTLTDSPSPVQKLRRLSDQLGIQVYCKRDDLTSFGFGGNKVRKLEFLLQDLIDRDIDTVVTCGSKQSNWCRMTATACAALGLECHLVLHGDKPDRLSANLLLDQLVGAQMHYVAADHDEDLELAADHLTSELRARGRIAEKIIMGGSTGLGAWGYIKAMFEILDFERDSDIQFDAIVHATGSGGTQAGLLAGKVLGQWPGRIIGMAVSRDAEVQRDKVRKILRQFDGLENTRTADTDVIVDSSYRGAGYRKNTPECAEAIRMFARHEGIFLDEVYSGKAAAGLIDYCRSDKFSAHDKVLFIHTGGAVQLFE